MKKSSHFTFTSLLFSAVMLTACNKSTEQIVLSPKRIEITAEQQQIVSASNNFGFILLDKLVSAEQPNTNVFISPLSIQLALSMTLNGAREETNIAMRHAMQFGDMSMNEVNVSFKNLISELFSVDPMVVTQIANSIWYRNDFEVEQTFIDLNAEYYSAMVTPLNFDSPEAKNTINEWVNEQTKGRIPDIVDAINPDHVMFLINAIYFKGLWRSEFESSNTRQKPFYMASDETKTVPFMVQTNTFPFYRGENFAMADLPYGRGNFSMSVLLPDEGKTLNDMVAELKNTDWQQLTENLSPTTLNIELPKFRFSYDKTLNDILTQMGMGIAFSDFADFSGINPDKQLAISRVKHKTFVEVNEEGTEAAAATSVEIIVVSVPITVDFIVNRPFIFAIREKYTNAILFIGCVNEPVIEN